MVFNILGDVYKHDFKETVIVHHFNSSLVSQIELTLVDISDSHCLTDSTESLWMKRSKIS